MLFSVVKLHFCYFPFFWLLRFPLFLSVSVDFGQQTTHSWLEREEVASFFMGKGASFKLGQNLRVQS